jgi:hypothetical protein
MNKLGQKHGPQRGNRQRFPYEPRVIGGKLLMPTELQAIHRYVVETPVLEAVTEEIRAVVKTVWPELISKLPPKFGDAPPSSARPASAPGSTRTDRPTPSTEVS